MGAPRTRSAQPAPPKRVTLGEFAARLHRDERTILRNRDFMCHALKEAGRWTWSPEFMDQHCESLPEPIDRNQYPHTKADVARLVGVTARSLERWGGGKIDATGQRQRLYSDEELCRFIIKGGVIGLEAICYFLEARNSNPVVLLIDRGHLRKPDTVDRLTGEWLWRDPEKVLKRCDDLLAWINEGDTGHLRQDLADCCDWEAVSGMEELEQWALEEADRVQAKWLERSRSPAAQAERERIEAERQAEERRRWIAEAPKREAEWQAELKRREARLAREAEEKARRRAAFEVADKARVQELEALAAKVAADIAAMNRDVIEHHAGVVPPGAHHG